MDNMHKETIPGCARCIVASAYAPYLSCLYCCLGLVHYLYYEHLGPPLAYTLCGFPWFSTVHLTIIGHSSC